MSRCVYRVIALIALLLTGSVAFAASWKPIAAGAVLPLPVITAGAACTNPTGYVLAGADAAGAHYSCISNKWTAVGGSGGGTTSACGVIGSTWSCTPSAPYQNCGGICSCGASGAVYSSVVYCPPVPII